MKTIYYANGNLQDTEGAGLNTRVATQNDDGTWLAVMMGPDGPAHGYQAREITEAEYNEIQAQLGKPDNVKYFWGLLGNMGLVDADTHAKILDIQTQSQMAYIAKAVADNRLKLKIARRDAADMEEDPQAVFVTKYPDVPAEVVSALFAKPTLSV